MIIKGLKMHNFRQFSGDQETAFSIGKEKNVTIILGDNGTGKTTFLQSFLWCLYGKTDFQDSEVINLSVKNNMMIGDEEFVSVSVLLTHHNIEYEIIRRLRFIKSNSGEIKQKEQCSFEVLRKDIKDGQTKPVPLNPLEAKSTVNEILPEELSSYFFFDGERLEKMSKEIKDKKESETFANAVRNLLGLSALEKAVYHLKGGPNCVISKYRTQFKSSTGSALAESKERLEKLTEEKIGAEAEKKKLVEEHDKQEKGIENYEKQLQDNSSSKSLADNKVLLKRRNEEYESDISKGTKRIYDTFADKASNFFMSKLISDAAKMLSENNIKDAGVPDIRDKTIEFLFKRKKCICGTCLEEGSEAYSTLKELLKYIPPQSLGNAVHDFLQQCDTKLIDTVAFITDLKEQYADIDEKNKKINSNQDEINRIEKQLDVLEDITEIQEKKHSLENRKDENIREQERNEKIINEYTEQIQKLQQEIDNLGSKDQKNRDVLRYKECAEQIASAFEAEYKSEESKIKTELETEINSIFKTIYDGGLSLHVDEKYHIRIQSENGEWVETSTAQSNSAILAFITSVIEIAKRQASEQNNSDNSLLVSEPYPLVMDAPLSNFDKTRIKSVCGVLPMITEQTIFFINDVGGELAKKYMSEKIGKEYVFNKIDEYTTRIEER
jgi:DNA sulfur modification protein DndD